MNPITVYILECADGTYYTGVAVNLERRLRQHNTNAGAKYTRGRGPCRIVAQASVPDLGDALRLESYIKRRPKHLKVPTLVNHNKGVKVTTLAS